MKLLRKLKRKKKAKFPDSKLPVELWQEIFWYTGAIPGKHEFCVDGPGQNVMICDDRVPPRFPTYLEARKIAQTRLNIIQVCKHWYTAGIEVLWSHIFLNPHASAEVIKSIRDKLKPGSTLAAGVLCVRVQASSSIGEDRSSEIVEILRGLPSLMIVTYPRPLGVVLYRDHPEVIIVERDNPHFKQSITAAPETDFWIHTRVMRLTCGGDHLYSDIDPILHFPRLENLRLNLGRGVLIPYIAKRWEMPVLNSLSIESTNNAYLAELLARCSATLERLELAAPVMRQREDMEMPCLRVLYIQSSYELYRWIPMFKSAPQLYRIGVYQIPQIPWIIAELPRQVSEAMWKFPTIREVSFRGEQGSDFILSKGRIGGDIARWRRQGINVDIR